MTDRVTVPPGWYPDPAGSAAWRAWNGSTWTALLRPYGHRPLRPALTWPCVKALTRWMTSGALAHYLGWALVCETVWRWHHLNALERELCLGLGATGLLVGYAAAATAIRQLRGSWSLSALLPLVNVAANTAVRSRRGKFGSLSACLISHVLMADSGSGVALVILAVAAMMDARGTHLMLTISDIEAPTHP